MFIHILAVFVRSASPLSFAVFLPTTLCEETLPRSAFNTHDATRHYVRRQVALPKEAHAYIRGEQHSVFQGEQARHLAEFGTSIIFLQNDAGADMWPATDATTATVLQAWEGVAAKCRA